MHHALTAEQEALRVAVGTLLDRHGSDPDVWARLCREIGVAGLAIPEEFGGAGAGIVETCVVAEELGRTLTPCPLLGSVVLAGHALLASGDAEACRRLLPGLADGSTVATLAMTGPDGHWSPDAVPFAATEDADWSLTGEAHYVLDGDVADVLLVAATTPDGIGLFEVPTGDAQRTPVTTMDPTRRLAVVTLDAARGTRLGSGDARPVLATALDAAHVVLAAEQVGVAAECLRRTVEYSKSRVQFGRPIGGFQALQHRMADLYVTVETARSAARSAAMAPLAEREVSAAVASVYCSEALSRVAAEMIQLHGGIAITWEHDAHLYFKRAHSSAHLFGRPAEHVVRLADLVGIT